MKNSALLLFSLTFAINVLADGNHAAEDVSDLEKESVEILGVEITQDDIQEASLHAKSSSFTIGEKSTCDEQQALCIPRQTITPFISEMPAEDENSQED